MENSKWEKLYEQINQRSRWYSSQIWYIPFAFIGLTGIILGNIAKFDSPLKTTIYFILCFLSISVFVHVASLKYHERRSVSALKKLESELLNISGRGTIWYMSFVNYIKMLTMISSYLFLNVGLKMMEINGKICIVTNVFLSFLYFFIIKEDIKRNKQILKEIDELNKIANEKK